MAFIKDALSALPAKPAVMIAPVIVIAVLSMYYWDLYSRCDGVRENRSELRAYLDNLDAGERFRLVDFTDFDWNRVRIVARVAPGTIEDECMVGWNWDRGEREALLEAGQLSALIFGHAGKVVGYFELRRDQVAFPETETQLTPESAIFGVEKGSTSGVVLSNVD
jgi:hypothetical protein